MELSERLVKDRYQNNLGNVVFTERFLIRLGACCGSGCRHCPYVPKHVIGGKKIHAELKKLDIGK